MGFDWAIAGAHFYIGYCYRRGSNGVQLDLPVAMQWYTKAGELKSIIAQVTDIGEIYLMGFTEYMFVRIFDRDVPLGMKYLRGALALAAAERKKRDLSEGEATATPKAEALTRDFHSTRSCMGCGSSTACTPCSGCLNFDKSKVWYCGEVYQRIHWRHKTASHKAECGSRAGGRGVSTNRDSA